MRADKFILNLDKVELNKIELLPDHSGIYYVVDIDKVIWYIGQSKNIRKRWNDDRPHHRFNQLSLLSLQRQKQFFIYYYPVQNNKLYIQEARSITKYQPLLNNTPVDRSINYVESQNQTQFRDNEKIKLDDLRLELNKSILSDAERQENQRIREEYADYFLKSQTKISMENDRSSAIEIVDVIASRVESLNNVSIEQFERKFIYLEDEELRLYLDLEICLDRKNRPFVRHHVLTFILQDEIQNIIDKNDKTISGYISGLHNKCRNLSNPLRWVGYQIKCEQVLLYDPDDNLTIKTKAIMLPLRLFIDVLEDRWFKDSDLSKNLEEENNIDWFANRELYRKIRKYLYDQNTTLKDLFS